MAFAIPAVATAFGATEATASTLATIGSVASVAGSAVSAFGALKSAKASASSDKYNAAVAANNAIIANRNAGLASAQGNADIEKNQLATRAKLGAIKANQGASGVDINSGSAVDVRSSAAETGQLSALDIRTKATRQAYGYQQNADDYTSESGLDKAKASNDESAGYISAGSTLLGGVAQAGLGYADYLKGKSPVETWANGDSFVTS